MDNYEANDILGLAGDQAGSALQQLSAHAISTAKAGAGAAAAAQARPPDAITTHLSGDAALPGAGLAAAGGGAAAKGGRQAAAAGAFSSDAQGARISMPAPDGARAQSRARLRPGAGASSASSGGAGAGGDGGQWPFTSPFQALSPGQFGVLAGDNLSPALPSQGGARAGLQAHAFTNMPDPLADSDSQDDSQDGSNNGAQSGAEFPSQPQTALDLTDDRKQWLLKRAIDRIDDCRTSMGLEFGMGEALHGSWAWFREIAMQGYEGKYDWRAAYGGVFAENNWSMNVPKRFIRLMAAKVSADLLGTEPFFAAMPEKGDKAELSKAVEKYMQKKVGDSNLPQVLREAVRVAICTGERAVKLAYVTDRTAFRGAAVVAVGRDGLPVRTTAGDYIYPKDDIVPDADAPGRFRLEKDPTFVIHAGSDFIDPATGRFHYQMVENLPQSLIHKDGLEAGGLAMQDFLYPIEVPSLDKADIMVHVYDEAQENLERMYPWEGIALPEGDSGALSSASQPNDEQGEQDRWLRPRARPLVNVHETYIRCDADEDGEDEWIFAVIDYKNRELIYAEYLGAMNLKMPPFVLIRGVESVPGRAYGSGVYKMFMDKNLFIDVQLNRVALKSSKDGSITFVHKDGTEETKAGLTVTVGDKKQYTIPANTVYGKDRPPVFRVNLNEVDEFGFKLLETMIQTGMLEFGIVSAADGSETDLNASGTATGVRNIERTGNLLHRMTEDMIADDIELVLDTACDIIIENMRPGEAQYDPDTKALLTLDGEEIRTLRRDVRLLLTKVRSEEAIQASTQVVALLDAYYGRPKWMRKIVRPEYIKLLKNLDVQDADERLEEPTEAQIAQEAAQLQGQPQQGGAQAGPGQQGGPQAGQPMPPQQGQAGQQGQQLPPAQPMQPAQH